MHIRSGMYSCVPPRKSSAGVQSVDQTKGLSTHPWLLEIPYGLRSNLVKLRSNMRGVRCPIYSERFMRACHRPPVGSPVGDLSNSSTNQHHPRVWAITQHHQERHAQASSCLLCAAANSAGVLGTPTSVPLREIQVPVGRLEREPAQLSYDSVGLLFCTVHLQLSRTSQLRLTRGSGC